MRFFRNKRGSITIMLSIILVAALSLNSTLIEMAKYRSMKQLYKEMTENASFSVLSYYDRDLYENFGFLALEQGVGNQELQRYLDSSLRGTGSGLSLNRADVLADIKNVSVEGIYPLSQRDVYRAQMMEFGAYRAPASMINNALNIEETLSDLMDNLEDALPILTAFKELSGVIEAYVDTVICLQEYVYAAEECQSAEKAYIEKLGSYNAALSEIDSFKSSYESTEEDGGSEKDENYEAQLEALEAAAEENAADLRIQIEELDPILEEYEEKMKNYMESYEQLIGANVEAVFAAAKVAAGGMEDKSMGKSTENLIDMLEDNYEEGEDLFDKIKERVEEIPEDMVESARMDLKEQKEKLNVPVEEMEQMESVENIDEGGILMFILLDQSLNVLGILADMVKGLIGAIETILKGVGAMTLAFNYGVMIDLSMNHSINEEIKLEQPVTNPYAGQDEESVNAKLQDAAEIAQTVGYDTRLIEPGETWEASALESAMNQLTEAESNFRTACSNLHSGDPVSMLLSLIELVQSMKAFIEGLINLITTFVGMGIEKLTQEIYRKAIAAVYATEMFSNRVTDTGSETRLNGSSFFTESDYADASNCFVQADAEYIYAGMKNELINQTFAFSSILMVRMLCNITAVFTDEELVQILSEVSAVPIIGWIVTIVIILVKLFLEAWYDMICMIYAKEDVDILKMDGGYFSLSGDGLDDLKDMVEKVIEEQVGIVVEADDDDDKKLFDPDEYAEGLLKWGYKDHLFLLMLLFTPSNAIYNRSATLIETQLREKKKKDGAQNVFELEEMWTYIRVEADAEYQPLLPVPVIPGLNGEGIPLKSVHYSGY